MEGLLDQIGIWLEKGRSVALATVIKTWGSSPRPAGAMMAITDQGEITGSVSGGCVEGAVVDAALEVIKTRKPTRLHFGVADEEAWNVGLSCGGEIDVFVRVFTLEDLAGWQKALKIGERFCLVTVLDGEPGIQGANWCVFENGKSQQSSTPNPFPPILRDALQAAAPGEKTIIITLDDSQIQEAFLSFVDPPRKIILVGGVHIAIPLASLAETIGLDVIVIDPRRLFGTSDRFPSVKQLLQEWPQEAFAKLSVTPSTAIVMLTHDPKIDDPAIKIALDSRAFYIGALGSRNTHQKRKARLIDQGINTKDLSRIHAPVGLDLGASSPEEIALAILAEVIQVWHQRD